MHVDRQYDVEAIKRNTDLIALICRDIELRRVSGTGGGEYAGPCPRCKGDDRFHCQPNSADGAWWFCRQCHPKRGDAIDYVRWRDGVGFYEACAWLTSDLGFQVPLDHGQSRPALPDAPALADQELPSKAWQDRAQRFVAYCEDQLYQNFDALAYLTERRLTLETIRAARLGYHSVARHDDPTRWGLDGGPLWLPAGWVIPCTVDGQLAYVKIRQLSGEPKYVIIRGGRKRGVLFGLDDLAGHTDGILVEGEFNALILRQALAGIAGVASLGDAGNRPGHATLPTLVRVKRWWSLHDMDVAGARGQAALSEVSNRVQPLGWPFTTMDINDAYLAGHDLAAWAVSQIGPKEPALHTSWAEHHLGRLRDRPDFDDETSPTRRVWRALLAGQQPRASLLGDAV
ncbi:MAG: primase-helicase zinc-binding domain-containing protein [Anaerolineae bacterium]